jgi:hypothetical protein
MRGIRMGGPPSAVTRDGGRGNSRPRRAGRDDYRFDATGVATLRHGFVQMARMPGPPGPPIIAVGTPPFDDGRTEAG